jgi:PAS domain S-box-containing protein
LLLLWLPLAALGAALMVWLYRGERADIRERLAAQEIGTVRLAAQTLVSELTGTGANLLYLAHSEALAHWLAGQSEAELKALGASFSAVLAHKRVYEHARLLDNQGREVLRVDWNDGAPRIAAAARSVDQSLLSYVDELLRLQPGQIDLSRFALEPGADSGRPVIRIATPVSDPRGQGRGFLLLDFQAERLIARMHSLAPHATDALWLLDGAGYWVYGGRPEDQWGFAVPGRRGRRLGTRFPGAWSRIAGNAGEGQFEINGALYSYARVSPTRVFAPEASAVDAIEKQWLVVARVSPEKLAAQDNKLAKRLILIFLAVAGLSGLAVAVNARHELSRQRMDEQLQDGEAKMRALVESAPDSIVVVDEEGRIVLINAQTETMFGYARAQLIGQSVDLLVPESHRHRHAAHRRNFEHAPRVRAMGAHLLLYGRRKDGSTFPASISLSPIRTASRTLVFADVRDISDQRAAEQRIKDLNASLERHNADLTASNRELEAFSYSVAHDLRGPLRAIDGFARLLVSEQAPLLDETGIDRLQRVRRAAQKMGVLIDDLLKLSRVTRTEVHLQEVDLSILAREVLDELLRQDPERSITFSVSADLRVRGDAKLLRIALEELLENAWKFTSGRESARIEFGQTAVDGEPAYYVKDNGAGFDMSYANKLFGTFQRLHDTVEFSGTGIGLATVQRIIQKHGGRIWAEGAVDQGATLYFTIAQPQK